MAIGVHRHAYLAVTQGLHNHPRIDTLGKKQRRRCVSEIVETDIGQACLLQKRLELPLVEVSGIDGRTDRSREYEAVLLPLRTRKQSFLVLSGSVILEGGDGKLRQDDASTAPGRLRLNQL